MDTPTISDHARDRCRQMGISTKVCKRIVRHWTMTYPNSKSGDDARVMISDLEPDYLVVVKDNEVLTVGFNTPGQTYERCGTTYVLVDER